MDALYIPILLLLRTFYVCVPVAILCLQYNILGLKRLTLYGKALQEERDVKHKPTLVNRILDFTVPKRLFTHFYILGASWSGTLLFACLASWNKSPSQVLALSMMLVQTSRRLVECLSVVRHSHGARMHLLHYVNGILFYTLTPLSTVWERLSSSKQLNMTHTAACLAMFFWCSLEQWKAHRQLAKLRTSKRADSKGEYFLPREGWFAYVACPHYLFEVGIYVSIAVIYGTSQVSVTMWLVVLCVGVELSVAADSSWKWYRRQFARTVGSGRWGRMIPFVY